MSEPRFLEVAPEGFDATMELKWIECEYDTPNKSYLQTQYKDSVYAQPKSAVLCQKWRGAFRDVWVRVPVG